LGHKVKRRKREWEGSTRSPWNECKMCGDADMTEYKLKVA